MSENDCPALYLRIDVRSISFLRFILEGHDGLAALTTIDRSSGLVRLLVPRSRYHELLSLLNGIGARLAMDKAKH